VRDEEEEEEEEEEEDEEDNEEEEDAKKDTNEGTERIGNHSGIPSFQTIDVESIIPCFISCFICENVIGVS